MKKLPTCPKCRTTLPQGTFDDELGRGVCPNCRAALRRADSPLVVPKGIKARRDGKNLILSVSWKNIWLQFAITSVVVLSFVLLGLLLFLTPGSVHNRMFLIIGKTFLYVLWIPSLFWLLLHLVNRTTLVLDAEHIVIRRGPIPFLRGLRLPIDSLLQLYCTRHVHRMKGSRDGRDYTWSGLSWSLQVRLEGGRERTLLRYLKNVDLALFLEEAIEEQIGIDDRPIVGEVSV